MVELHHSSVAYDRFSQGVFQIKKHGIQLSLNFLKRCFACDGVGGFVGSFFKFLKVFL